MDQDRRAPLVQPPRLRTGEERTASRLELFFDLAYILVLAELATGFTKDLTAGGAATFAGLLTVTWWSWTTVTLYANRFDTNDIVYRLAKLGATVAVIGMAASAREATGKGAVAFAASYLVTRALLLLLYLRAWRHVPEARSTIAVYLAGVAAGSVCWAVSLPVHGAARYALWGAGILVEAVAPLLAGRVGRSVPLHLEHLPERFALFVILVLGESIASLVHGVHDTTWTPPALLAAAVAFVAVAALWWIYFDLGGASGKRELLEEGDDQESGVADAYVYGHLPVVLGLSLTAVGIEELILHPQVGLAPAGRWALTGGVALYLLGVATVMAGTSGRWLAAWPWPAVVVVPVVLLGVVDAVPPTAAAGGVAAILVLAVLAGIRQQRRGTLRTTET
jgi:low temperature requirement protein LtrA